MPQRFKFHRKERLKSPKIIEQLFQEGKAFFCYPFRVVYLYTSLPTPFPAQVLVSVSKKKFRKAVDRNRIRRQVKETYRLHKNDWYETLNNEKQLAIIFIYIARQPLEYAFLEERMQRCLKKLSFKEASLN